MTYLIPQQPSSGGVTLQSSWRFSTTTAAADPGTRTMRYDNATPANVLNLYLNDTTNEGFDASTILGLLVAGNRIYVQQSDDAANATLFQLTGPAVDNTGWWTVPVSVVTTLALPVNNKSCAVIVNLAASAVVKTKIIEIGDWNMDTTGSVSVAHGLVLADIRSISVLIRGDSDTQHINFPVVDQDIGASGQEEMHVDATNVIMVRGTSGFFDNVSYDSTSFNRGWITVNYV